MSRRKKASPPPPRESPDGLFRAAVLLTVCAALAVGVANVKGKLPQVPAGARLARSPRPTASHRPTAPVRTAPARPRQGPPERAAETPTQRGETLKERQPPASPEQERRRGEIPRPSPSPEAGKPRPAAARRASPPQPRQGTKEAWTRGPSPAAAGPPPTPPASRTVDRSLGKEAPEKPRPPALPGQRIRPSDLTPEGRRAALRQITLPPGLTSEIQGGKPGLRQVAHYEIARGNPKYPRVALTFDADGDSQPLPAILEALRSQQVVATFFLTGRWADRNPDLVRRIQREGHELANHSYSHAHLPALKEEDLLEEVARTEHLLYRLTGQPPSPYVRFPYGDRDVNSLRLLIRQGYLPVYWSLDSHDWMESVTDADILKRVVGQARPGDILLLHATTPKTARVLPQLLAGLARKGLACGPVSSVLLP
jgi:peptidoglycan/xylan/chitin deacetylase (PgdA/CDA1 family)